MKCPCAAMSSVQTFHAYCPNNEYNCFSTAEVNNIARVVGTQRIIGLHIHSQCCEKMPKNELFYLFYRRFIVILSSNIVPFCIHIPLNCISWKENMKEIKVDASWRTSTLFLNVHGLCQKLTHPEAIRQLFLRIERDVTERVLCGRLHWFTCKVIKLTWRDGT